MAEQWTVKTVDGVEPKSAQETEQAVVETAAAETPNVEVENNEPIKVDLDNPPKQEEDVVPKGEELSTEQTKESTEEPKIVEDGPLELINEQESEQPASEKVEEQSVNSESREEQEVEPKRVLPEDVDKLIAFMDETGGTVADYAELNKDINGMDDVSAIREYYRRKNPHMSEDRLSRKMDKQFLFDNEADEADVIQDKKDLFEDELFEARNFLNKRKEKYYADLKLNKQNDIAPDLKEARDFYSEYKQTQESNNKLADLFQQRTDKVFNEEFKGFDFQVGENKYRYKVADREQVKNYQSDLNNFIDEFTGENGDIQDVSGYHKALFAAKNADKLAQHFYEQGKADAVRQVQKDSKNIDMQPRSDAGSLVTPSGSKVRVVSGDSGSKLKWKIKK